MTYPQAKRDSSMLAETGAGGEIQMGSPFQSSWLPIVHALIE
jgi:hypothetical protein